MLYEVSETLTDDEAELEAYRAWIHAWWRNVEEEGE